MKLEKCHECGLYYDRHERGECPYCKPDCMPMVYALTGAIALLALCALIFNL